MKKALKGIAILFLVSALFCSLLVVGIYYFFYGEINGQRIIRESTPLEYMYILHNGCVRMREPSWGYTPAWNSVSEIITCDIKNFEILSPQFSKDREKVYFNEYEIKDADPQTIRILGKSDYSIDQYAVYFQQNKIEDLDSSGVRLLNEEEEMILYSPQGIYFCNQKIPDLNPRKAQILEGSSFIKDDRQLYLFDAELVEKNEDEHAYKRGCNYLQKIDHMGLGISISNFRVYQKEELNFVNGVLKRALCGDGKKFMDCDNGYIYLNNEVKLAPGITQIK